MSIIRSGQFWEGDSVTLSCSSDSNPPAEISWFKEDQSSSVGSGQSFSALQSGRFYCEAHNQHGSQRSDAVTVTGEAFINTLLYLHIIHQFVNYDDLHLSVHHGAGRNVFVITAASGGGFIIIITIIIIILFIM